MTIQKIENPTKKSEYVREVLGTLPDWFGNPESLNEYVEGVRDVPFFAAMEGEKCLGFFAAKIHYGHTGDIYVCGVRPEHRNEGLGQALYLAAEEYFRENGCKYVIVKTLSDIIDYPPYEETRKFYEKVGFEPLLTLTEMWDEENPCLIMIKTL